MEWLLLIGSAWALAGGVSGERTAWPLLAGVAFCCVVRLIGLPFVPLAWLLVDGLVITAIVTLNRVITWRVNIVIVLFIPLWAAYVLPEAPAYYVSTAAVVAQLLLVGPWGRLAAGFRSFRTRQAETSGRLDMAWG